MAIIFALVFLWPAPLLAQMQSDAPPQFPLATNATWNKARSKPDATVVVVVQRYSEDLWAPWRDPRVAEWMDTHATGFRFPVVARNGRDESVTELSDLWPGVAAFRNGQLIDQDVLFASADEFLEWLAAVEHGPVSLEYALKRAGTRTEASSHMSRAVLALRFDRLGKAEQADDEFAWLLERSLADRALPKVPRYQDETEWHAFRRTHPKWDERAEKHLNNDAAAVARLTAMRDDLASKAERDPAGRDELSNWLAIERLVPDSDRVLSWYRTLLDDPAQRPLAYKHWDAVFAALVLNNRWADAGRITTRPFFHLVGPGRLVWQSVVEYPPLAKPGRDRQAREMYEAQFAGTGGMIYAALLAAGREEDARLITTAVFQVTDAPFAYGIVVEIALNAGQTRPELLEWAKIADTDPEGERLTAKVEAALARKAK